MRRHILLSIVMLLVFCFSGLAYETNDFSVQGYVFEKDTLRPLSNINIYYSCGTKSTFKVKTDANGFYCFTADDYYGQPMRVQAIGVYGKPDPTLKSFIMLPYPAKADHVYERNLYIDLPKYYEDKPIR